MFPYPWYTSWSSHEKIMVDRTDAVYSGATLLLSGEPLGGRSSTFRSGKQLARKRRKETGKEEEARREDCHEEEDWSSSTWTLKVGAEHSATASQYRKSGGEACLRRRRESQAREARAREWEDSRTAGPNQSEGKRSGQPQSYSSKGVQRICNISVK